MINPTTSFARLYDAQYRDYLDDLPWWINMLQRFGKSVVELGCGSGRVLIPLLEAGASVLGLDRDPWMLEIARARLAGMPKLVQRRGSLVRMDLRAMGLRHQFSLAIAPLNTLATFNDAALTLILRDWSRLLESGGALVCDLPNPGTALDIDHDPEEILDAFMLGDGETGAQVRARISPPSTASSCLVEWIYETFHPDGGTETIALSESYYLRLPESLAAFGKAAGFHAFEAYGDYDLQAYGEDSPRLLACFVLRE